MCIQFLMGNKFSSKFSKHLCSASNKRGTKRKLENDTDSPQSSDKEEASSQAGESPGTGSNFEVGLAPLSDIHTPKRLDCEYIDTHLVLKKIERYYHRRHIRHTWDIFGCRTSNHFCSLFK